MRTAADARLVQVGWMLSPGLAAEFDVTPLSDDYLITLEQAEEDGGVKDEFADRVVPIYRKAEGVDQTEWTEWGVTYGDGSDVNPRDDEEDAWRFCSDVDGWRVVRREHSVTKWREASDAT